MDVVVDGLWFRSAARAGCLRVLVRQGGLGGQVAFCRLHLVDPPCYKLPQAHQRVWREGGEVVVVGGCGRVGGSVLEEHVPSAGHEGLVGLSHELGGGSLSCAGGGHVGREEQV